MNSKLRSAPPALLTVESVAERLGVTPDTVDALIVSGDLVAVRVAACWRIEERALDEFIGRRRSRRLAPRARWAVSAAIATALLAIAGWAIADVAPGTPGAAPQRIPFRGYLERSGIPVDAVPTTLQFDLYENATSTSGETVLWTETHNGVMPVRGRFDVSLGTTTPIPESVLRMSALYVAVTVIDGGTPVPLAGRQQLLSVPYARQATNAVHADDGAPTGTIIAFATDGTPPAGWADCDGASVSGADGSPYRALYLEIGETWGDGGDGAGPMFTLPSLGGRFLRGAHGASIDPDGDRAVGDPQSDALRSHAHGTQTYVAAGGSQITTYANGGNALLASSGTHAAGGPETRPTNVAVRFLIKL